MTKADIVDRIQAKIGYTKKESVKILESIFSIMKDTLEAGEDIRIIGFGGFIVKNKADRKGRNPATGEDMIIVARRVLTFKASQLLKQAINA